MVAHAIEDSVGVANAPSSARGADSPHCRPAGEVVAALGADVRRGLDLVEVERRAGEHGPNDITTRRAVSAWTVLVHQLLSPVVYLLAAAAVLAGGFGEWEEAIAILLVLILNTLIGYSTEIRATRSIEALRRLGTQQARVRRGGQVLVVEARALVPGDIVLLTAGDAVPADLRIVEAANIRANESTLTGESVPVAKRLAPVDAAARLPDRACMLYRGTFVTQGGGVGVVTATGARTELGHISALVSQAQPEASPLEKQLARLSTQMVWLVLALAGVIGVIGVASGRDVFLIAESAIALAVAAIPEGLPIAATLALARGMWRMARANALIARLPAVETLGATTVILTDKTGTLTENRMTVRRIWVPTGEVWDSADLAAAAEPEAPGQVETEGPSPHMRALLEVAALCNEASLGADDAADSGDPMEIALLRAGRDLLPKVEVLIADHPPVRKHAFDADTRMMATVHAWGTHWLVAVKGAPEAVVAAAETTTGAGGPQTLDAAMRSELLERIEQMGAAGLRVLGFARKHVEQDDAAPYDGLEFLGLVALEDPIRADVPAAIAACSAAGVRVVMVTGDHAVTARNIAGAAGLGNGGALKVVQGVDPAETGEGRGVDTTDVFARVSPAEKLDLVRHYQKAGEVVAMTGDGVNDAPALRQADIGVAMGMRGTDVAREAAAMVLLDDAFPTIVKAIRQGRVIFGNIQRFVQYLLSCNMSEVLVVSVAVVAYLPLPLLPLQILYLNLVTDVLPAFALAMGEGDSRVMTRAPRRPGAPILGRSQWLDIVYHGTLLTAATFISLWLAVEWLHLDSGRAVTVTFLTLAFSQLWQVFNTRHPNSGLMRNEITANPWVWGAIAACAALLAAPPYIPAVAGVMGLSALDGPMWVVVIASSLFPLLVGQATLVVRQAIRRSRSRHAAMRAPSS